jgi:hypothetical protein
MSDGKSDSGYVISAIDDTIVRKIGEIAAYVEREKRQ